MNQTQELIKSWLSAKNIKDDAERIASSAKTDLANAINELGKRLMAGPQGPDDAPVQISVWVPLDDQYERLLTIKKKTGYGDGDYQLEFHGEKREI